MRIPVVMVSDTNYISPTRVAIWSMRKSTNKDIFLDIIILCSAQLEDYSRKRLSELESIWTNLKITFYEISPMIFLDAKPVDRIPITSFYRLIIPELLKFDKKCLFLDGDIIVNTDLKNLYLQDLGDAFIAGVRDNNYLYNPEDTINHLNSNGFTNFTTYINAGVMIFNIEILRKENCQYKFLKCMETSYPYMDQDILNKVCDGKIKVLDQKFNFFNMCINEKNLLGREWEILHFAGGYKPWNHLRILGGTEWWKRAEEALEIDIYRELYENAYKKAFQSDWSYILKRCLNEKILIIVGYSSVGIEVLSCLKRCGIKSRLYFCDNSKEKQRLSDDSITIFSVEELVRNYPEALWINTSQYRYLEINAQLNELGISEERILVYRKKDDSYYRMLDGSYREYELKQIQLMNGFGENE